MMSGPSRGEDRLPPNDAPAVVAQAPALADTAAPSATAALRPSADAVTPEAGPDERGALAAEAALALRLPAEESPAVPMEKLDDALMTTGSTATTPAPAPAGQPEAVAVAPAGPPAAEEPAPPPAVAAYAPADPTPAVAPATAMAPAADPEPTAVPPAPVPAAAASTPATAAPADLTDPGAGRAGRINASVKMRAKPDNGGGVVSVLAANENVTVLGCDVWCEIEAAGKRGYVFKKFVETP